MDLAAPAAGLGLTAAPRQQESKANNSSDNNHLQGVWKDKNITKTGVPHIGPGHDVQSLDMVHLSLVWRLSNNPFIVVSDNILSWAETSDSHGCC